MLRIPSLCLALVACTADPPPGPPTPAAGAAPASARPNVVLITIDTLRADHLGAYGHDRPTSPWMDALAAQGAVFEDCTSTSSWTPPAMASLMTAVYPHQHGYETAATQLTLPCSLVCRTLQAQASAPLRCLRTCWPRW